MKKIIINKKYYGKIELPKTRNAYKLFVLTVKTFSSNEEITLKTIYSQNRLKNFEDLNPKETDIYLMTYDRDLKERFKSACNESNNLYALQWKIL